MTEEQIKREWAHMVADARYYADSTGSATIRAAYDSEKAILAINDELSSLREKLLNTQIELGRSLGKNEEYLGERKRIAEAVSGLRITGTEDDGTTSHAPPTSAMLIALADRIERGEV